jgi:hypothetical protein
MSELDRLKRAFAEKTERDAAIAERIEDQRKHQEAKDAAHIELRAREDLDAWARCFQVNLNQLSGYRPLELHYKAGLFRAGFKWTSQARYNHAPNISLRAISGDSGRLFPLYAVKVTQLLGTPFKVAAIWHEHDRYPYQLVPHKYGSSSHGYYARQRSHGYFALWMQKNH